MPEPKPNFNTERGPAIINQIPLDMYNISGQDNVTAHSFKRYQKDKEQYTAVERKFEETFLRFKEKVLRIPPEERTAFIREALGDKNFIIPRMATRMIEYTSDTERGTLIREALDNEDREIRRIGLNMVMYAPYPERTLLINEAMGNKDKEIRQIAVGALAVRDIIEKKDRFPLVRQALQNKDVEVQRQAAKMIQFVQRKEQALLIREALENEDVEVQKLAANTIKYVLNDERAPLIREVLKNKDLAVQAVAVEAIDYMAPNERDGIRQELSSNLRQGLESEDIKVKEIAAELIKIVLPGEQPELRKKVSAAVKQGLESEDIEVEEVAARMINYAFPDDQDELRRKVSVIVRQNLGNEDTRFQQATMRMIKAALEDEQAALVQIISEKGLEEQFIQSPLYNSVAHDPEFQRTGFAMQRRAFAKTGSGTSLIGGELKDNTIIRHIRPSAFLTWQKLYEDHELWKKEGFDYVPIEPIQSYRLNEEGVADVFSGVLDLSLGQWYSKTKLYKDELEDQRKKILRVIDKKNITHGHTHFGNFCLRFFRNKEGKIDFSKVPRLYLIDFDQAVSPEPTL